MKDAYRIMAWCYDLLARVYGLGRIEASKRAFFTQVKPGDRVLVPGAGSGSELPQLIDLGALVTVVDLSPRMLARLRRRLGERAKAVEIVCSDVTEHHAPASYDWIFASYFLNVFDAVRMRTVMAHLRDQLRPGGSIAVSDFARPSPGFSGLVQQVYYGLPLIVFALTTGNAWHGIFDYVAHAQALGLEAKDACTLHVTRSSSFCALRFQRRGS